MKLPEIKKEVIVKRYVGFLYERRDNEKEISNTEPYMLIVEYLRAMYEHLSYFVLLELDFKYVENDIKHLYYSPLDV